MMRVRSPLKACFQVVLNLTGCLCLATAAQGQAAPSAVNAASMTTTKNYRLTRDDIMKITPPEMGEPYGAGLGKGMVSMIKNVSNDTYVSTKLIELQGQYRPQSFADKMLGVAAFRPKSTAARVDAGQGVTKEIAGSVRRNIQNRAMSYATFISTFKKGLNFHLNPSSWFDGTDTAAKDSDADAKPVDNVRYGLILKNIEGNPNGNKTASINGITMEELQAAAKAKLEWTIGPVAAADEEERMFNVHKQAYRPYIPEPTDGSLVSKMKYYWQTAKMPSTNFEGGITPTVADPQVIPTTADPVAGGLPPMRVSLWQEDEFYRYDYYTNAKGKKIDVNHTIGMNVYRRMRVAETRNEKMQVIKTSLLNVLAKDKAPIINLYYLNLEKRYQADYTYHVPGMDLIVTMDTPTGWQFQKIFREKKEKYQLTLSCSL